jgi:large subunit ribosomal protein L22
MRQVAALVRGLDVRTAEQLLRHVPKAAATPLAQVIKSATANALSVEGTAGHKADELVVTDVRIDGGPIARRFRATGMGRAYRIRKRYCHVSVVVSDEVPKAGRRRIKKAPAQQAETKQAAA